MDPPDVGDQSVYALISALCKALCRNLEFDDAEAARRQIRFLRRIAFTHFLNRSPNIERNVSLTENIPLALYAQVVAKKIANEEYNYEAFQYCCKLLERLEASFGNAPELSRESNIGRMLIALGCHLPQPSTSSTSAAPMYGLSNLGGLSNIPSHLRVIKPNIRTNQPVDPTAFTLVECLYPNFRHLLQTIQLPQQSIDSWHSPDDRPSTGIIQRYQAMPRSASRPDEGFSSPSDVRAEFVRSFDWSNVAAAHPAQPPDWESFPERPMRRHFPYRRTGAMRGINLAPVALFKVSYDELIESIKALLVGVSSHLFDHIMSPKAMKYLVTDEMMKSSCNGHN